ncbi:metal-dependent phosphohydrolase [Ancylothrix sp. C2]|uniref:Npun_R2479 family HD domain-containing metalloprotein n=1 Tax=Ancylothrix sp. D3o TaxID=2953691 RepID=UPI0021BAF287|nr:Npun_R2479 family HD domain-containing metalloprotein [Ancylothrix sp. D3o]MCT7948205.1 metal-dependent phosphohydrolase [Ancylothrix sp. D3o]
MFNLIQLKIDSLIRPLQTGYRQTFGNQNPAYADLIACIANIALENIAKTDALYHNIDHTILVTLVGQEILRGKQIKEGNVSPEDWVHCIIAWLCHDIGYVKGVCRCDKPAERLYQTGTNKDMISVPTSATDASLTAYHIDRGKLFVQQYLSNCQLIDINVIQRNIEHTRFPVPPGETHKDTVTYPGLVRAADLIGQLSDPEYLQKLPALFYEFEETGTNKHLGYKNPGDLRAGFPKFYWNVVYQYIEAALPYLEQTPEGRKILDSLTTNISTVEAETLPAKEPQDKTVISLELKNAADIADIELIYKAIPPLYKPTQRTQLKAP